MERVKRCFAAGDDVLGSKIIPERFVFFHQLCVWKAGSVRHDHNPLSRLLKARDTFQYTLYCGVSNIQNAKGIK